MQKEGDLGTVLKEIISKKISWRRRGRVRPNSILFVELRVEESAY